MYKHLWSLSSCLQAQDIQGPPVVECLHHTSHGLLSGPSQTAAVPEQNALCSSFCLLLQRTRQSRLSIPLELSSASPPRSLERSKANPSGAASRTFKVISSPWSLMSILMLSAGADKSSKAESEPFLTPLLSEACSCAAEAYQSSSTNSTAFLNVVWCHSKLQGLQKVKVLFIPAVMQAPLPKSVFIYWQTCTVLTNAQLRPRFCTH